MDCSTSNNDGSSSSDCSEEEIHMKKKAVAVAFILALSLSAVTLLQFVDLAAANWYVWYPQTPNRDPPMLRIESPQSNSVYENNVTLKFTVTKPDSWAFEKSQFPVGNIVYIGYSLDDQENSLFEGPTNAGEREYLDKITHYSVTHTLSDGPHSLVVEVSAKTWYLDGTEPTRCYNARSISLNVSDMIHFTVFASSGNWSEVARFSGGAGIITTEPFTCDHVDWRIRWEYEPRTENPEDPPGLEVCVYTQEYHSPYFERFNKWGTEETNGTLYIHNKNGTFHLAIICGVPSYTIIVEQDVNSIPEFPSWTPLLIMLLAVTALAVIYRHSLHAQSREGIK